MIDVNVLNYFVVILSGFGVVWGYRHFSRTEEHISEFEYAAFSALWGIPIALALIFLGGAFPSLLTLVDKLPMIVTPTLFSIGVLMGWLGAKITPKK